MKIYLDTSSIFPFPIYYLTLFVNPSEFFFLLRSNQNVLFFKIEHQIGFQQELIRNAAWCSKMTCFISGVENNHQPPDKMLPHFDRNWCVHPRWLGKAQPLCDTILKNSESGQSALQYFVVKWSKK